MVPQLSLLNSFPTGSDFYDFTMANPDQFTLANLRQFSSSKGDILLVLMLR